jgi:hypothetical protein
MFLFYLGRQMLLRCALNRLKAQIELCFNFLNVQGPRFVDLPQDSCDPSRLVREIFSLSLFYRASRYVLGGRFRCSGDRTLQSVSPWFAGPDCTLWLRIGTVDRRHRRVQLTELYRFGTDRFSWSNWVDSIVISCNSRFTYTILSLNQQN